MGKRPTRLFKVAAISNNTNAFGLRGVVLIAEDGEAWEVASDELDLPKQSEVLSVPTFDGFLQWGTFGFEIPRQIDHAPAKVVREVWGGGAQKKINLTN